MSAPVGGDALRLEPERLRIFGWLALLSGGTLVLYVRQFQETNAYAGILPMRATGSPAYWAMLVVWLLAVGALVPSRVRTPSDAFLAIYLVGGTVWSAAYWPATGLVGLGGAFALLLLTVAPAVVTLWMRRRLAGLPIPEIPRMLQMRENLLVPAILAIMAVAALLAYRAGGAGIGFDLEQAYDRRYAGRESFGGSAITAYVVQMTTNGLAPYLAFLGMQRRSYLAVAGAFAFALLMFGVLGLKSPFLNVGLLAGFGWMVRRGRIAWFAEGLLAALVLVVGAAIVEREANDISLIAEFGIRRAVLVASMIQVYFADAILNHAGGWGIVRGLDWAGYPTPEFFVGEKYFGSDATNANTSAFLHQFASSGLVGYVLVVVAAAVLVAIIDLWFSRTGRRDAFAIAAIVGVLLLEQAFTIALVSSGVLLTMALAATFTRPVGTDPHQEAQNPQ